MKQPSSVAQVEHTLDPEWAVRVDDYHHCLLLTLKSSRRRALWTSAIAGLIIASVGFTHLASTRIPTAVDPAPAPLQLD